MSIGLLKKKFILTIIINISKEKLPIDDDILQQEVIVSGQKLIGIIIGLD